MTRTKILLSSLSVALLFLFEVNFQYFFKFILHIFSLVTKSNLPFGYETKRQEFFFFVFNILVSIL